MTDLLGFYIGLHDSNIAAIQDGRLRYRKFERRSGVKHERAGMKQIADTIDEWRIARDAHVAFSDGNRNQLGICPPGKLYIGKNLPGWENTICIDHHFAHALSGWAAHPHPDEFVSFAIDGKGDHDYKARVFRIGEGLDAEVLWESKAFAVGHFFTLVGDRLGFDGALVDYAGKLMGLQAYGTVDEEWVNAAGGHAGFDLPYKLLTEIPFRGHVPLLSLDFFQIDSRLFLDWLASAHAAIGEALVDLFFRYAPPTRYEDRLGMEFTGGCAQNSVYNELLTQQFPRLTIPAHCYDGGISLGCLNFLMRLLDIEPPDVPDYPFIQDDEELGYASPQTQETVAGLIADNRVVGWMQGRGEIGPRALGHRSILFNPTHPDAQGILNSRVKNREPWRPFAASVSLPDASFWFEGSPESPWMQRALTVRPAMRRLIPGVVHKDGTCRAQTVDPDDYGLHAFLGVITRLDENMGVPLVLNTSLNGGGEPIYGSRAQGERLLASGQIDALVVGDELLIGG